MPKTRYHFNPKSLTFEKVRSNVRDRIKWLVGMVSTGMVFSAIILVIAYNLVESPKEKILKREIEQYKFQYQVLNDRLDKMMVVMNDLQKRDDDIYRVIFEAEPIPASQRLAGYGGADRYEKLEGYDNSKILIETTKKVDRLSRMMYVQSKSYDEVFALAKNKSDMLMCIPAIQPISNKDLTRIASGFGFRIHPIYKGFHMHTGIDFTAPRGTPVYATGNGKVIRPDGNMTGYGQFVVVDHGYGYKTVYAHLSRLAVRPGQKVTRGQVIGYVGNTGISTGPHLHYEVRWNNKPVDPINYFFNDLKPEEYKKLIELASKVNQALS